MFEMFPRKKLRWTRIHNEAEINALKAVARLSNRKRSSSNEMLANMSLKERYEAMMPGTEPWRRLSAQVKLGRRGHRQKDAEEKEAAI